MSATQQISSQIATPKAAQGRYPDIATVNDLFLRVASSNKEKALLYQDESGQWKSLSSTEVYQRVRPCADLA